MNKSVVFGLLALCVMNVFSASYAAASYQVKEKSILFKQNAFNDVCSKIEVPTYIVPKGAVPTRFFCKDKELRIIFDLSKIEYIQTIAPFEKLLELTGGCVLTSSVYALFPDSFGLVTGGMAYYFGCSMQKAIYKRLSFAVLRSQYPRLLPVNPDKHLYALHIPLERVTYSSKRSR